MILSKRRDTEEEEAREKEIEREVSRISSVFKETAKKEIEEVTTKWKEIVSEKDRRITELERGLEEEINRRNEREEIRKEILEQKKIMKSLQVQKENMEE